MPRDVVSCREEGGRRAAVWAVRIGNFDDLMGAVADPDGKPCPWYAQNVPAPGGTAAVRVPLAFSDRAGRWTILATDVLTGVKGSTTVTVAAAAAR